MDTRNGTAASSSVGERQLMIHSVDPEELVPGVTGPGDAAEILRLDNLAFGERNLLVTLDDFLWRRDKNPAGRSVIPVLRNKTGRIVACVWVLPLRISFKGRVLLGATITNLVVHPDYRGGFAHTRLARGYTKVLRDRNVPVRYGFPNERSYRQLRRRDPRCVTTLPLLFRILNLKSLVEATLKKPWMRRAVFHAGRITLPLLSWRRQFPSPKDVTVEAVDQFDGRFDELWDRVRNRYPIAVVRDRAFLAWRFANLSGRTYDILIVRSSGRMAGYLIYRGAVIRGIKTALIMDFLLSGEPSSKISGALLLRAAEASFLRQELSLAVALMAPHAFEYDMLRRMGYRVISSTALNRFRPPFRFSSITDNETDLASVGAKDWFVTFADWEAY